MFSQNIGWASRVEIFLKGGLDYILSPIPSVKIELGIWICRRISKGSGPINQHVLLVQKASKLVVQKVMSLRSVGLCTCANALPDLRYEDT